MVFSFSVQMIHHIILCKCFRRGAKAPSPYCFDSSIFL